MEGTLASLLPLATVEPISGSGVENTHWTGLRAECKWQRNEPVT